MLEKGIAPWQKPWKPGASSLGIPSNPTSNSAYCGGNAIHLMATGLQNNHENPRWMTYKQAADQGWQVRKGEKGTQIEFWEVKPAKKDRAESPSRENKERAGEDGERSRIIHRVYTVFNAKQIDSIPPFAPGVTFRL